MGIPVTLAEQNFDNWNFGIDDPPPIEDWLKKNLAENIAVFFEQTVAAMTVAEGDITIGLYNENDKADICDLSLSKMLDDASTFYYDADDAETLRGFAKRFTELADKIDAHWSTLPG